MRPRPQTLAEAAADPTRRAARLDEFLDAFYGEPSPAQRHWMIATEPERLNDERQDAWLGAMAEHLARRWGLAIPPWAGDDSRDVAQPWFVTTLGHGLAPLLLVESPIAFRRRRIFTEAEPLRRAHMPR